MDLSETFEKPFEQNPYSRELLELLRSAKSDPGEVPRLLASFNTKVTTDIELERRMLNSRIVSLRLSPDSPNALVEMKSIIEEFFDIAARRRLWGLAITPNLEQAYIDFLNQQKQADADRWEHVSLVIGDDTVDMILDGRVAYWTVQAKKQASRMRHRAVPPEEESSSEPTGSFETAEQRSARRRKIIDPWLAAAGITSPAMWAANAGGNMDKNTPRDYLNGKTGTLRAENRTALARPLGKSGEDLPD